MKRLRTLNPNQAERLRSLAAYIDHAHAACTGYELIWAELRSRGAQMQFTGGTYWIALEGVRASATAGMERAIGAWARAAHRRLANGGRA